MAKSDNPRVLVFSSLFPSPDQPSAGLFIRERMFRVGAIVPIAVVAPVPWFPFLGLLRRWKPGFRPQPPRYEVQNGVSVYRPRFFSVPGFLKSLDGFFMALGSFRTLSRIQKRFPFAIIDAHFAYPDGYAATRLGKWFRVPVTITLRGTEVPLSKHPGRKKRILIALDRAARIFSVSDSLKRHVSGLGTEAKKIIVIGNGVDTGKFFSVGQKPARNKLAIPENAKVLVSVGALVERKGFHRVIRILPQLIREHPDLIYLIVGGASPEGDWSQSLQELTKQLDLAQHIRFLGALPPDQLKLPLSAANVFTLFTSNEGWANVFLEAMACGLPVVTTDVGGNTEVVRSPELGTVVPFDQPGLFKEALSDALQRNWNEQRITQYASENDWDTRVQVLVDAFTQLTRRT